MSNQNSQGGTLDVSELEARVGQLVGGGQLWEPCSATDIRRWVMAMDYPNPIHWDEEVARHRLRGVLGRLRWTGQAY